MDIIDQFIDLSRRHLTLELSDDEYDAQVQKLFSHAPLEQMIALSNALRQSH